MKTTITTMLLVAGMVFFEVAAAAGDAAAGEAVYNRACKMCHASGMMGAPKTGDKNAWAPLLEQGDSTLMQHAVEGYGRMPPKGNCRACSDQDIADAVAYMVNQSR